MAQYGAAVTAAMIFSVISAVIARRIGPEACGIYATALSGGAVLGIFLTLPFRSILLTQIRQETGKDAATYLVIRCTIAGAVRLCPALVILYLALFVLAVVFGVQFVMAVDMLRVLSWLLVPSFALAIIF